MLRTLVLALTLAAPAVAQIAPGDVFPLDDGNRWVFLQSAWSFSPQAGSSSSREGSVEWLVDGTVEVDGEALPRLLVSRNGGTPATCVVGTVVEGDVVSFPFFGPDGTGECAVELSYFDGGASRSGFQVDLREAETEDLSVGGRPYPGIRTLFGIYSPAGCGSLCDGLFRVGVGVGVLSFSYSDDFGPGSMGRNWGLRRAEVDGETYGAPLDPGPGFFPLGEGDAWTFAVSRRANLNDPYEADGFVTWAAEAGGVLRIDRVEDGVRSPLGTCVATVSPVTPTSGYREQVVLDDAPGEACPDDVPAALPALDTVALLTGSPDVQAGVFVDFYDGGEVTVGGQAVSADVSEGGSFENVGTNGAFYRSSWLLARGLGVVGFEHVAQTDDAPRSVRAMLVYARVDGVEVGVNPVSDEPPPSASALGLDVSPNPTRGVARLTLSGEAAARVTVLDALGRVVRTLDAMPGAVEVSLDGLSAGIYVVRAETERGVASTRLTVVL